MCCDGQPRAEVKSPCIKTKKKDFSPHRELGEANAWYKRGNRRSLLKQTDGLKEERKGRGLQSVTWKAGSQ